MVDELFKNIFQNKEKSAKYHGGQAWLVEIGSSPSTT